MALGSTQPLTEMSMRNLPGGVKVRPARKVDNLTAICNPIDVSQPHGPQQPVIDIALPYYYYYYYYYY
jgi:hypothetical protein